MMLSWFRQLDEAKSASEVVAIARDYFAMWSPDEIVLLPESCRPARFRDVTDLEDLHRAAVEEFRKTRATGPEFELLQKLTGFIGRACVRIAQVRDGQQGEEPAAARQPDVKRSGKSAAARGR
jgi:hypothetical protein